MTFPQADALARAVEALEACTDGTNYGSLHPDHVQVILAALREREQAVTELVAAREEAARLREAFDIGQKALEAAVNEAVSHREHLAAVRPVVAAATKWSDAHDGRQPDGDTESAYEALWSAVDDLPAEAREWAAP